jgi:hypothetical protein
LIPFRTDFQQHSFVKRVRDQAEKPRRFDAGVFVVQSDERKWDGEGRMV